MMRLRRQTPRFTRAPHTDILLFLTPPFRQARQSPAHFSFLLSQRLRVIKTGSEAEGKGGQSRAQSRWNDPNHYPT